MSAHCNCLEYGHGMNLTRVVSPYCPVHGECACCGGSLDAEGRCAHPQETLCTVTGPVGVQDDE